MASRDLLQRRIAVLELNIPFLLNLFPVRSEFEQEFASCAGDIMEGAELEDVLWARDQIAHLLEAHALTDMRWQL
jgi:hypothetical protein